MGAPAFLATAAPTGDHPPPPAPSPARGEGSAASALPLPSATGLLLLLLPLLLAHFLPQLLRRQPATAALVSTSSTSSLPPCTPLHPSNNNGTWQLLHGDDALLAPRLRFVRDRPCAFSVGSAAALFARFHGRTLAFVGDSQVRELVRSLAAHALGCCWMQATRACDPAAVVNASACQAILASEQYPKGVQEFHLRSASGQALTLLFSWAAYPLELLNPELSHLFLPLVEGRLARPVDAVLMAWGSWDLIFTQPKRSDNLGGLTALLEHGRTVAGLVAAAAASRPALLKQLLWREMYPDEVDAWPHPQHRKRMIMPNFRQSAREGLRAIWGEGGVGLRVWDVFRMLDARAGGVQRAWNDNFLTMDGMHLLPEVNVELGWELLSYWAEEVVPPPD